MADETTAGGGNAAVTGTLSLTLNPPGGEASGVEYDGSWVRAELDGDKLTVVVRGQAVYAGRTLTDSVDLDLASEPGLEPLAGALRQVLAAYEPMLKARVMGSAFAARNFAMNQGEFKPKPEAQAPEEEG